MKRVIGYTRHCLHSSKEELMGCRVYQTTDDIHNEMKMNPDAEFAERSLAEVGFPISDFYVLEDSGGRRSYRPVKLVDAVRRIYKFFLENVIECV